MTYAMKFYLSVLNLSTYLVKSRWLLISHVEWPMCLSLPQRGQIFPTLRTGLGLKKPNFFPRNSVMMYCILKLNLSKRGWLLSLREAPILGLYDWTKETSDRFRAYHFSISGASYLWPWSWTSLRNHISYLIRAFSTCYDRILNQ